MLLWGNRWYFPDHPASEPFRHVVEAADLLAAKYAEEPKPMRLRLVYQPDALESVAVACPQGDRRVLTMALAAEYPALAAPDHAWGHEPILPLLESYATVLHFETEPALITLAGQLARLGLAVDSAWPLSTFLHALPEEWTESGAVTIVAARAEAAVAYHHPKDGPRSVLGWHGAGSISDAGQWLAGVRADAPSESVLLVCPDDETATALSAHLGSGDHPGLEIIHVAEVLGRRVVLPRYHPAQLLPRQPVITAQSWAMAASIALLLAAGWAGFEFGRDWIAAKAETERQEARLTALRGDVARLRRNAAEITGLRSLVEGRTGKPPCGALLRVLSTRPPPEIILSSLQIEGTGFQMEGWVAPSAPDGLLDQWRDAIAPSGAPWTLELRKTREGAFTAKGVFQL